MQEKNNKIYKQKIDDSLDDIENILNNLDIDEEISLNNFTNLFEKSSKDIISSWVTGRKYSRTVFTKKAFQNEFPEDLLSFSLSIDVMINILDDFLDERLSADRKKNYVIEFLRNFSIYNHIEVPQKLRDSVGVYMNKLITLALSEKICEKRIKMEDDLDKITNLSASLLKCRGMDMDIFSEIALINYEGDSDRIVELFRIFRALNIFKKDILDISYDNENGIKTVVILVLDKNLSFSKYSSRVVEALQEESKSIIVDLDGEVPKRIKEMIEEEKKEISKLSRSL